MAAVEATDCAMEGTVIWARRDEGLGAFAGAAATTGAGGLATTGAAAGAADFTAALAALLTDACTLMGALLAGAVLGTGLAAGLGCRFRRFRGGRLGCCFLGNRLGSRLGLDGGFCCRFNCGLGFGCRLRGRLFGHGFGFDCRFGRGLFGGGFHFLSPRGAGNCMGFTRACRPALF